MSNVKFNKGTVRDAWLELVPELASTKALEKARKRIVEVERGSFHQYNEVLLKSTQKYQETKLTSDDEGKIKLIDAEIAKIKAEIKQKGDDLLKKQASVLAKALETGDFAKVSELTASVAVNQAKATTKQQEEIRIRQKQINAIQNKKILAANSVITSEMSISTTESGGTSGTQAYSFAGQRFYIESPRKSAGYSVNAFADTATRRIWVKCTGSDWPREMRTAIPHFAGFWIEASESDAKNKIHTRTRIAWYIYDWIRTATIEKPKSNEDLLEITYKVNKHAEMGNLHSKYSAGADSVYRLVETFESGEKDEGHQRLYTELTGPDWDNLEEHEALVNAMIDAEIDSSAENEQEDAKSDVKEVKKAA